MKRFTYSLILQLMMFYSIDALSQGSGQPTQPASLIVKRCSDFEPNGTSDNNEWNKTEWNDLTKLDTGGAVNTTKFKILYSTKGAYVLFKGDDEKISTKYDKDFDDLYN